MNFLRATHFVTASVVALLFAESAFASGRDANDYSDKRPSSGEYFHRIATFPVYLNTDIDVETVAEIVDVSKNGKTLIYTDSEQKLVGFVDIRKPTKPKPAGTVAVGGEPTSVAVAGPYALVAVNTSADFVNTSGHLRVIHMKSRKVITDLDLGGQPDSVAVSPDGRYAAIAIENERDEDFVPTDGRPPQAPPGYLAIIDLRGQPKHWRTRNVDLVGISDKFPDDPEPEYVSINRFNIAAVTLQENNHIVLVHLPSGRVVRNFSAGAVDLHNIDNNENNLIELKDSLTAVPREPDGVVWLNPFQFATADEGDLDGGSRGFSIFDVAGNVRFTSGNTNDHITASMGHYPEERSENKGNEPENVEFARFGDDGFLFVASERASMVFVYKLEHGSAPELRQVLPAGLGPEGIKAIPRRGLLVAASEKDDRGDGFRGALTLYRLGEEPTYPTLVAAQRGDGTPIPWGALSALAYHSGHDSLYTVYDSFYRKSRILRIDHSESPPRIVDERVLSDRDDVLKNTSSVAFTEDGVQRQISLADRVNADNTVNLDPEGLSIARDGSFWVASEGNGNLTNGVSDPNNRPFRMPNLLLKVAADGVIESVVQLPPELERNQLRFGFEGVTAVLEDGNEVLYVAFQREWNAASDPDNHVRIGRYETTSGEWSFAYYEIDIPTSPNGGWVGLSEIVSLGGNAFMVIERDNQAGTDARTKKLYRFSVADTKFLATPDATDPDNVISTDEKQLARDLIADGDLTRLHGPVLEKVEGLAALPDGKAIIVTDNDGVDDSNGETQLLEIEDVF